MDGDVDMGECDGAGAGAGCAPMPMLRFAFAFVVGWMDADVYVRVVWVGVRE